MKEVLMGDLSMIDTTGELLLLIALGYLGLFVWVSGLHEKLIRFFLRKGLGLGRWAVRKVKESESRPYQIALGELILRAEVRWKKATGQPLPRCPYCGKLMMFRHSKIVTTVGPVRDDQGWKCRLCYHTAHFGIPMTREDALAEIELRGNPTLMRPSERPDEDGDKIVEERLRRLGYIE